MLLPSISRQNLTHFTPSAMAGFLAADPDEGWDPLKKSLNLGSDFPAGTEMV